MGRIILSIVAGVVLGGIAVAIIEYWLMYQLFEMPDSMIPNDPESVAAHLEQIPQGAKWLVVISQFVGALVASLVAAKISGHARKASLTAGLIMCAFTIMNLFGIPHPVWMSVAMPVGALLGAFIGSRNTI